MPRQSRPLLILTRPAPAAQRFATDLAARLQVRGLSCPETLIFPLMAPESLNAALPEPPPDGVLFTSETGVAALSARVGWRVPAICVGPQTELVAQQNGWPARMLGGDAERMVEGLTAAPLQGRWLHARGEDAAAPLAEILSALGMRVSEAVVYRQAAQPMPPTARAAFAQSARPVLVPVFSPRSGRLLVAELDGGRLAAPLWLAAISAAAARAMEPLAPARVEIAETPDGPGMLKAVERLLGAGA